MPNLLESFIGTPKPPFSGISPISTQGQSSYIDSAYREGDAGTVNTWTAVNLINNVASGSVRVPVRSKYLAAISVSNAWDGDASGAAHSLVRLTGSGLARGGFYRLMTGSAGVLITGTPAGGGTGMIIPTQTLLTGIPVTGGNDIDVQASMQTTDIGTLSTNVALLFSDAPMGSVIDFDCRVSANQTAVDTDTIVNLINGTSEGSLRVPTYARMAQFGTSTGYAPVTNTTVRALSHYVISGSGLAYGGSFTYTAPSGSGSIPATNNALTLLSPLDVFPGRIAVVGGNDLTVNAAYNAEDVGSAQFGVSAIYHA